MSVPLLVHYEPTNNIVPSTCAAIVAGVYVARPPVTNFAIVNLQNAATAHPLQNCQIPAAGSFNQLINSGVIHPTGVLIVPFLAPVTGTNGCLGDSQWKSPFDTCPCTTSPVSLTNLQVSVGGQNVLQSILQYDCTNIS
jgi:hypothetical protein